MRSDITATHSPLMIVLIGNVFIRCNPPASADKRIHACIIITYRYNISLPVNQYFLTISKLLLTILLVFDVFMRMKRRMCGFQIQKKALTFYSQSLIPPLQCLSFMKFYRIVLHPSHRLFDFSIQCPSR